MYHCLSLHLMIIKYKDQPRQLQHYILVENKSNVTIALEGKRKSYKTLITGNVVICNN